MGACRIPNVAGVASTWNNQNYFSIFSIFLALHVRQALGFVVRFEGLSMCAVYVCTSLPCVSSGLFSSGVCKMDQLYHYRDFSCSGSNVKHCWPIIHLQFLCFFFV